MKKFLLGMVAAVVMDLFVFPTSFTFLPSALNSKMLVAGLGLGLFMLNSIRTRKVEIPVMVLVSGILAALFSLWCLVAVTEAGTYDMEYVSYIKSFFTWLLGAYGAVAVMKLCTGKDDLRTLTRYIAIVCVAQCVLAILINNVGAVSSLVDRLFSFGQDYYKRGSRLYGIACALDVAGVRFSAILVLIAHQIARNPEVGEKSISISTFLASFLFITVVGCMIARTTVVGAALGLGYMAVANMKVSRGGFVSSRQVRIVLVSFLVIVGGIFLGVYLYNSNTFFYNNVRFGFENFFNWVETGEFRSGSTDQLQRMWVWPSTRRGWIMGEGIVGVFKTNSDIGYCNFILYCGLIGLGIYSAYYIYNHLILNTKFDRFGLASLLLVAVTFIVWSKVQTDIFFIDALLFCIAGDPKYYNT